jgi:hypothetical protein
MTPIEQYRSRGLREPIRIHAGLRFHALLWGGGGFLMLGSVIAMEEGGELEQMIGAFGFVFFGVCLSILLYALVRGGRRGLLEISGDGLFMSHIGIVLPWRDIGPAWIQTVRQSGMAIEDVGFVVRNADQHMDRMGPVGRFLFSVSRMLSRSRKGGVLDWGLHGFLAAADAGFGSHRQMGDALEKARTMAMADPGAVVFNVPVPLRMGISASDLLGIINAEMLSRSEPSLSEADGRSSQGT